MNLTVIRPGGGGGGGGGVWVFIAETILDAPAATVTFAAIPGTYRALALLFEARSDRAGDTQDSLRWRANGDSAANYDGVEGSVGGAAAYVARWRAQTFATCGQIEASQATANYFTHGVSWWHGYTRTDKFKNNMGQSGFIRAVGSDLLAALVHYGGWRSTAATASLTFFPSVGPNFITGCSFTLYGIT